MLDDTVTKRDAKDFQIHDLVILPLLENGRDGVGRLFIAEKVFAIPE